MIANFFKFQSRGISGKYYFKPFFFYKNNSNNSTQLYSIYDSLLSWGNGSNTYDDLADKFYDKIKKLEINDYMSVCFGDLYEFFK